MNEENYSMPTQDERENPGKSWEQVVKDRDFENSFKGQFKCNLCPKKVINDQKDLGEHVNSKGHKKALGAYYKINEKKLKHNVWKIKQQVTRKYLFNMPKLQKIVRIGIHYKLMSQLHV